MEPLLSVVTITYNHEPYIAKCIEGVLMQKVNFPIEFIIAEDCSTDGTRAICEKYATKHPKLIRLITSETNIGYNPNELRAMKAAKGKYIAYCEGDDYWTDPMKLQKQVDFLETNPNYSICFHRCRHWNADTDEYHEDACGSIFVNDIQGADLTLDMFFEKWITQPLTMVFRASCFDLSLYGKYKYYRDMHQIYHLLKAGQGYLFAFEGGIRTVHEGGMASKLDIADQCRTAVLIAKEIYSQNKDFPTKRYYSNMLQWYLYNINDIKEYRIKYSIALFLITGKINTLMKNILR